MRSASVRFLVRAALIAAVYVALCFASGYLAYGPVQLRLSEALTLLPALCLEAIPGVTVGCLVANLLSPGAHVLDIVFGTLATFGAALLTRALRTRHVKGLVLPASVPPVALNALVVGTVLYFLYYYPTGAPAGMWLATVGSVGLGQIASCCVLGVALVWFIEKRPALRRLFAG